MTNIGCIYKIKPIGDYDDKDCYYGSTILTLSLRFINHITSYKRFKLGKTNKCSVFSLFDKYGVENCYIQLVEQVDFEIKQTLLDREIYYIKNNPCVNITFNNIKRKYSKKLITLIQLYQSQYFKKKTEIKRLFAELPFKNSS
jgi:hypothetical protein